MVTLTGAGVLLTSGTALIAATRGIEQIKADTSAGITGEAEDRTAAIRELRLEVQSMINNLRQENVEIHKTQYHDFGETATALRRFIEEVQNKVREVEIWGRDHYVQKPEFQRSIDTISNDLRSGFSNIAEEIRAIRKDIAANRKTTID